MTKIKRIVSYIVSAIGLGGASVWCYGLWIRDAQLFYIGLITLGIAAIISFGYDVIIPLIKGDQDGN